MSRTQAAHTPNNQATRGRKQGTLKSSEMYTERLSCSETSHQTVTAVCACKCAGDTKHKVQTKKKKKKKKHRTRSKQVLNHVFVLRDPCKFHVEVIVPLLE